ncbi:MAG TPA: hypothetical protein VLB04_13545 [Methanotrichaceae archaeon]|nr:hypothetical protein [Methanotrichaceae archaeon]
MRTLLMTIVLVLLILPALAQPVNVGGEFGKSWLNSSGSKNVVQERSGDLWTWGAVPKGQMLINGILEPIGISTWYYPFFPESSSPIILNATSPIIDATPFPSSDFSSRYPLEDPWFVAQITGHPVIFRTMP